MIEVDGGQGEAGGQILRSALALSICTQQPFRLTNVRIHRDMPGLLRRHVAAISAAADIANADVNGAQIGSRELTFRPRQTHASDYTFDVGANGSCSLVLQTVLPVLLLATAPSTVRINGGTHHKGTPSFDCLQRAFIPLLEKMGAQITLSLSAYGFPPQGAGGLYAEIAPSTLTPIHVHERGARISQFAEAYVAGLPADVGQRELTTIARHLHWQSDQLHLRTLPATIGRGNAISVTLAYEQVTEVFTGFTEPGVRAETVAQQVALEVENYLSRSAPIGPYLADQLLLPMALCGSGSFTTMLPSAHFRSNSSVIERFTGRRVAIEPDGDNYRVTIV
jgi:RNA 3'-terminal phosphate cyclase (ATP)